MSFDSHTIKTGIFSSTLKRANTTDSDSSLVEKLVVCANKHTRIQLKAMFANAAAVISEFPESHGFSVQRCSEANRLLLLTRRNIIKRFMFQLNRRLKPAVLSGINFQQTDENEFVSHEEVDAMLAITAIHSNAMSVFGDRVQQLETRLEYLEISLNDSFDKQAVSPKQLCAAFYEVLVRTGMKAAHIAVLLKLYDLTFSRRLSGLYESLNAILIEADVLPNIILNNHSEEGEVHGGLQKRIVNYYDPQENKEDPYIKRTEDDMNYFATNYMSGEMTVVSDAIDLPESFKTEPSYDELNGKGCYSRKDVVVALSRLQQAFISDDVDQNGLSSGDNSIDIRVIKYSLLKSMNIKFRPNGGGIEKHVNLLDERSIDFVGMLFGAIAEDDVIHPLIKSQLMRLQISVIKVSITDKSLFENEHHPVRNVLNLITDVGQDVQDEDDSFYLRICSVISRLLKDYYMDISSFRRAENELIALNSRKVTLINKKESEEKRKIIREHARNVVLTELKCLSAKKTIPKAIQPLVLKYLPTLMINQYVLHGRDSEQWNNLTALLKKLIQCLQPLKKNDDWAYLNDNASDLIMELSTALCKTGQNVLVIQGLLANLRTLFQDTIFDFGFNNVEDSSRAEHLSEIINDMEILETNVSVTNGSSITGVINEVVDGGVALSDGEKVIQDALSSAQLKINKLPDVVHPGVWFEIYNGEEHAVRRLKLSVILNDTAKIVFCDRRGNTVMEKDAADFSDELATDKSRMIADHSTFGIALGSVIASPVA